MSALCCRMAYCCSGSRSKSLCLSLPYDPFCCLLGNIRLWLCRSSTRSNKNTTYTHTGQ